MLNEYLLRAYRQTQTKEASRQLQEKLARFPLQDLIALASGDPTAKLAYCDGPCEANEPKTWLDKFKGSPLFEKAVSLEKTLLEADAASDAKRSEERETDRELDARRDELRMQKRLLDLDLALEQEGAAAPAEAATAAPTAQAEPAPIGGGTAVEVKQASSSHNSAHVMEFYRKRAEFLKIAGAVGAFIPETRSTGRVPATDRAQGAGAGEYTVDPSEVVTGGLQVDKVAALQSADKPKVDPQELRKKILQEYPHLDKRADFGGFDTPEEHQQAVDALKAQAAQQEAHPVSSRIRSGLGTAAVGALGGSMLGGAAYPGVRGTLVGAGLGALGAGAYGATRVPGAEARREATALEDEVRPEALRNEAAENERIADDVDANPGKYRLRRGIAGGIAGGLAGAGLGSLVPRSVGAPLLGAGVGALTGGGLAALRKPDGAAFREDAATMRAHLAKKQANVLDAEARAHIKKKNFAIPEEKKYPIENKPHAENALSRVDTFGTSSEKSRVHSAVARHYPGLAARSSVPDVASKGKAQLRKKAMNLGGILQGAKSIGSSARNLAVTSHAAGGLPQVAKSFGNVAKGFVMKNPLAAAGAAGLGGAALGRATAPSRP